MVKEVVLEHWTLVQPMLNEISSEHFLINARILLLPCSVYSYTLAADLNANLDDLTRTLMQMIDSVNELSESPEDASGVEGAQSKNENPLEQIAQILSSHLESLQWIDGAVREVDSKVTEVERLVREASSGSRVGGNASTTSNPVGLNGSTRSRGFGFR